MVLIPSSSDKYFLGVDVSKSWVDLADTQGHVVYRVNARRVRAFMESVGIYAKTDAIDAKALADYAAVNKERLHPFVQPDPDVKALRQWPLCLLADQIRSSSPSMTV